MNKQRMRAADDMDQSPFSDLSLKTPDLLIKSLYKWLVDTNDYRYIGLLEYEIPMSYPLKEGFITTFIQSGGQTSASWLFVTVCLKH